MRLTSLIMAIFRDNRAATAVEYGLIVAMIVLAMIAALQGFADSAIAIWEYVQENVVTA